MYADVLAHDKLPSNSELTEPPAQESPKLCINCQHIGTNSSRDWEKYRCFHPNNKLGINLVTGEDTYRQVYCMFARRDYPNSESCGTSGQWYQERAQPTDLGIQHGISSFGDNVRSLDNIAEAAATRVRNLKSKKLTNEDLENL